MEDQSTRELKDLSINKLRRAWIEIDEAALRRNYRRLREHVGRDCRVLPMVKSDGYGLGATRVLDALAGEAPWGFGVATVEEGEALRSAGWDGRVVVFSPAPTRDAPDLVEARLEPTVNSLDGLRAIAAAAAGRGREVGVHLNLDTGMGRLGLDAAEVRTWAPEVGRALDGGPLRVVSTFTHYHSAESDDDASSRQWSDFRRAVGEMREAGLETGLLHAANSAAAVRWPDRTGDAVRPGVFLYGWSPAAEELRAEAVVRLRARVLEVRRVSEGATVSYGASFRTSGPSRLATLGLGYGDGLRRTLSNRGEAIVRGERVPIRGRVCMDITVVDVTGRPEVRPGDVATLLGSDGECEITLEEMAGRCDTIAHEILTGFTPRLPRLRADESPSAVEAAAPDGGAGA